MVEEEVVDLVGADDVLGLLLDVAVFVGWDEFGGDGGVDDVLEDAPCLVAGEVSVSGVEVADE